MLMLNLQLFADGGEGVGTGAEATTGVGASVPDLQSKKGEKNPLAGVKYGIQNEDESQTTDATPKVAEEDRNAKFEELIKGEFKDLYDARMQDTIQKRLKIQKKQ